MAGTGSVYVLAAVAQRALSILLLPIFASILGPSDFGVLALATSVSTLIGYALSLGLDTTLMRDLHRVPATRQTAWLGEVAGAHRRVASAVAIACGLAAIVTLGLGSSDSATVAIAVLATAITAYGTTISLTVVRAREQPTRVVAITAVVVLVPTAARLVTVVWLQSGAFGAVLGDVAVAPLVALAAMRIAKVPSPRSPMQDEARKTVRDGLPMIPHLVSHWALALADRLIIAPFVGVYQLGIYSLGYQAAFALGVLITEANRASLPFIVRHREDAALQRRIATAHVSLVCAAGVLALSAGPLILSAALPPEFDPAQRVFVIVALAYVLMGLYFVPMNQLTMVTGETGRLWRPTAAATTANIVLNALLAPRYGIEAAAAATLVSYAVLLALLLIVWHRSGGLRAQSFDAALAFASLALVTLVGVVALVHPSDAPVVGVLAVLVMAAASWRRLRTGGYVGALGADNQTSCSPLPGRVHGSDPG